MNARKISRSALIIVILLAGISCRSLIDVGSRAGDARETAQSAISQAQELATQGALIANTAQAFATQNPALIGTAQAFFTEQGPVLLATAQALATEHPGLLETAQALVTQGISSDERPAGIPLPAGDTQIFFSTSDTISFSVGMNLEETLMFYQAEMAAAGWQPVAEGTIETGNTAVLNFARTEATATVTMTYSEEDERTIVLVNVREG
jgi:hypothetical protein